MKTRNIFLATTLGVMTSAIAYSQNVAINTSGSAAAATNMLEVTQTSTAANMVAMYAIHSGATAGTGYGLYATKTGASTTNIGGYFNASGGTNNYAIIVPSAGGNVGIGTTSPTGKLDVDGTGSDQFYLGRNGSTYRIIGSNGTDLQLRPPVDGNYVRIADGNTANSLDIEVSSNVNMKVSTPTATGGCMIITTDPLAAGNGDHIFKGGASSAELMRIKGGGNVGIGIAAPGARLDVVYPGTTSTYASKILHSGNASSPGTGLAVSNGYPTSSGSGAYEVFGVYANSFAGNLVSVRDNGNVGIGTTTPGAVPGWTALSNMRALEVSGDGSAGTFTDGVLLLSNNRAAATVGDQVGALCFAHKNNAGNFPAVICSYLTGAGGANGFGAKLEFHTKANNVLGHLLRMEIDQDGYIGIGKASPTAHVDIYDAISGVTTLNSIKDFTGIGNTNAAFIGGIDFGKTNTGIYVLQKDNIGFSTATTYLLNVVENGSSKMVVTGQGNVGIGTVPGEIFTVHVAANQNVGLQSIGGIPTILAHNDAWGAWQDIGLGNNVLVAKSTGLVGIGTTAPSQKLDVIGNIYASGDIYLGASAQWLSTIANCVIGWGCSDLRYKKEITPFGNTLAEVLRLQGVKYNWRQDEFPDMKFSDRRQIGFIAQDMEKVFPEIVNTNDKGYKSIDYAKLTPVLVEAIKEQQKMIEDLRTDKAISNARIEKLEALVGSLVQTSQK